MAEIPPASGAVFLSYASQDVEAAKRICEALRAAGIEVWFDQSELVGGDQWDGKIRGQISSCALFVPVISANTQARLEGYFRLEWKLAAQRTHTMADEKTFLLPVLIDGTRDAAAKVPAEFKSVQWTKLPGGETPPAFVARVQRLLEGPGAVAGVADPGMPSVALAKDGRSPASTRPATSDRRPWLVPAIAIALALVTAGLWFALRSPPASVAASTAVPSEAERLVTQARELVYDPDSARNEFALADNLVKRATELAPDSARAWGVSAFVNAYLRQRSYDADPQRAVRAQGDAEKALRMDPQNPDALIVLGGLRRRSGDPVRAKEYLERARAAEPSNPRIDFELSFLLPDAASKAEFLLQAAAHLPRPAETYHYAGLYFLWAQRYPEAVAALEKAAAAQPFWRIWVLRAQLEAQTTADPAKVLAWLERVPDLKRSEPRVALMRWKCAMLQRNGPAAVQELQSITADFFTDNFFSGPKALLQAEAHELAGQRERALEQWQVAERSLRQKMNEEPASPVWRALQVVALTGLKRTDEARDLAARCARDEYKSGDPTMRFVGEYLAEGYVRLGDAPAAISVLRRVLTIRTEWTLTRPELRTEPRWDPLRAMPEFQALVQEPPTPGPQLGSSSAPFDKLRATQDRSDPSFPPDQKSVAVLAFANLSDDKGNEYFSDGISEELLNVLAKVPGLKVSARTSAFHFKGKDTPIPEIAQKLGVAYVIEGSVRKQGDKVRITAQLIKAADGFHVWSETYDRNLTDIFAVQDEIAKNILGVVKGSLMGEADLPHATTTKIEAYTLYLQAQGAFATRSDAGLHEAVRLFEAALAIDPDYVPALVGLAFARVVLPSYVGIFGPKARALFEGAKQAAQRALELEPRNTGALTVIGCVLFTAEWRWKEGEAVMLRARASAPHDALVENFIGDYFRWTGDNAQAVAAKRLAWELDPLRAGSHWDLGYTYLAAKDYDQALHWGELTLKLAPHNLDPYYVIIMAAGQSGRYDLMRQTIAAARQNVHENEGMRLMLEAHAAILEKNPGEARRILTTATALVERGEASPAYLGYCHLLLGESEQAMRWMQRGYDLRDIVITWSENIDFDVIAANPVTRPILDRPGLKELYELRQRNARAGLNKL